MVVKAGKGILKRAATAKGGSTNQFLGSVGKSATGDVATGVGTSFIIRAERKIFGTDRVESILDAKAKGEEEVADVLWYGAESLVSANMKTATQLSSKTGRQNLADDVGTVMSYSMESMAKSAANTFGSREGLQKLAWAAPKVLWYGATTLVQENKKTYERWTDDSIDQDHSDTCTINDAARVGSLVSCPMHGEGVIVAGNNTTNVLGHPIAVFGDATSCGATLMPPPRSFHVGGLYVARVGDPTSHGGFILTGIPSLKVC